MPTIGPRTPALRRALSNPQPVRGFGESSPVEGLARRSVGFFDVLAQSVAAVAPTGVALTFPAIVITQVGGPTLIAAALAIVATLLVAMNINEFARRMAVTGSLYTYVAKALGSVAGYATALSLQLGYGFISVFCLASSVAHLRGGVERTSGWSPPAWLLAFTVLGLGAAVVVLIVRGIRLTLRVLLIIEAVTAAVVLVLVIALLVHLRGEIDWSLLQVGDASPQTIGAGAAVVMTALVGFESSAALGAEAKRPFRDIPRALVWCVLGVGVLYFLAAASQIAAFGSLDIDPASTMPVNQIVSGYGLDWIGVVLDLSIAVSFFACAAASSTALVRVVFSLGREGVFPRAVGRTRPQQRTPVTACLLTVPVVSVLPALALGFGASLSWIIDTSLVVATVGYLVGYFLVAVSTPVFLWRLDELTLRPVVVAGVTGVALAGVVGFYVIDAWGRNPVGLVVFAVGAAAGWAYFLWRVKADASLRGRIGIYDEPVAADVLGAAPSPDPAPERVNE